MDWLKRHEVWIFLCGIVLINALFVGGIAAGILPMKLYSTGRFLLLGAFLFTCVALLRQMPGVVSLLRPMTVWRVSPAWYVLVPVWAAANALLALFIKSLVDGSSFLPVATNWQVIVQPAVIRAILLSSFVGEIVWVAYAIGQLSRKFPLYVAALITGAFWTAWWMPMVLMNIGVVPDLPVVALLVTQCGIAIMCALLYWRTGSGLLILLMQIVFNSTVLVFPVSPGNGDFTGYYIFAAVYFTTATLMFIAFGPRRGQAGAVGSGLFLHKQA